MRSFLIETWVALWAFIATSALAEPIQGASYIGICNPNFPCKKALQNVSAVGYLADSFGHRCQCVQRFLTNPGMKYLRVHLSNGTCFPERNRRCGKYDVFRGETLETAEQKLIKKDPKLLGRFEASILRTKRLLALSDANTTIRYSLSMEAPFSNKARLSLLEIAKKHLPEEALVDSVLSQRCLKGLICEKHGDSMRYAATQRCISDTDGLSLFDADIDKLRNRSKQCEAIFYWSMGFNLLKYGHKGSFIYPYKRSHKAYDWEFEGLRACIQP
jgi:hypothetical protein